MSASAPHVDWYAANQHHLLAALAGVREALDRHAGTFTECADIPHVPPCPPESLHPGHSRDILERETRIGQTPTALDTLCATFGLGPFERDILVLCAGMALDTEFGTLCARAGGVASRSYPTFDLALAALDDPHWSALTPDAPLRRWQLIAIDVTAGYALTDSPLRIDERVLHYLTGASCFEARLEGIVAPAMQQVALVPSHQALARRISRLWADEVRPLPLVQLCGEDEAIKQSIAAAAFAEVGLRMCVLMADALPSSPGERETVLRLWQREAILTASGLYAITSGLDTADARTMATVSRWLEHAGGAIVISTNNRWRSLSRPTRALDVGTPSTDEQRALWQGALCAADGAGGFLDAVVAQFNLSAAAIQAASREAGTSVDDGDELAPAVWEAGRAQARPGLDGLAQRIEPSATWADLVLPDSERMTLREIAAHARNRATVYGAWGFAARTARGLGISALFAGASGTGKTMAAEVLATDLRLDLYCIDLSQVISKYIGETEKNLRRVFDAAEQGGAILLFDEADALFGKRSEVKDSHDRYANIEVGYLLQRMESYRGLAILTTNMRNALDPAFARRIRFVVHFPFPTGAQRAEIWRRVFPPATPTEGLEIDKLARLNVAGGSIRNIALNAAFLAADAREPVRMAHLLQAARGDYARLEKPLTAAEIEGWI